MLNLTEIPGLVNWGRWAGIVALVILAHYLLHRVTRPRVRKNPSLRVPHQIFIFASWVVGLVIILVSLPIENERVGQLVSFFGILLSGAIALSSTNFLGNLMAGLMLRSLDSFRLGDFVRCDSHFGRVSDRGLFHTEIQTEDGDLTTLPNLLMVTNAITVVRSEGTLISALVSIGYDVDRLEVEEALLAAAAEAGLEDAFVSVTELGDYSVVYRVAGLLRDVKRLITRRSRLRKQMIDALHAAGIEIMSPSFFGIRNLNHAPLIPSEAIRPEEVEGKIPESVMFSKAEQAESLKMMQDLAMAVEHEIDSLSERLAHKTEDTEKKRLEGRKRRLALQKERLDKEIAARIAEME
jgi:small-conductance mechanosensitive channel